MTSPTKGRLHAGIVSSVVRLPTAEGLASHALSCKVSTPGARLLPSPIDGLTDGSFSITTDK